MLAGSTSATDAERCQKLGCSEYVLKPRKPDELLQLVRDLAKRWVRRHASKRPGVERIAAASTCKGPRRILLVDDNLDTLKVLTLYLTTWGYEVDIAHGGEEAWQKVQEGMAPDVVLLDWLMPVVSGLDVARRLRELPQSSRPYVIMISVKRCREDLREGCQSGADDYMAKPVFPAKLRKRLEHGLQILDMRRALV